MCTAGFKHFSCGCSSPIPATVTKCESAKQNGSTCATNRIKEDKTQSKKYDQVVCTESCPFQ